MLLATNRKSSTKSTEEGRASGIFSPALEWLWRHFRDERRPQVLDCGPVHPSTVSVMVRRGAKLYVADLVSPAQDGAPAFWDRTGKQAVFRVADFLAQLPKIPTGSLSAVYGWHLLDLLPPDAVPAVVARLGQCLQAGGFLFCLLHEPYMAVGSDSTWWLEDLAVLGRAGVGKAPFPYAALTNRDVERLVPGWTVKTFLTRSGLREVLLIR